MIFEIKGPPESGKTFIAQALRNTHNIQKKGGVLLLDEDQQGHPLRLLEKLLVGELDPKKATRDEAEEAKKVPETAPLESQLGTWDIDDLLFKDGDILVIVVGDKGRATLAEIEKRVPGFVEMVGPRVGITTEAL